MFVLADGSMHAHMSEMPVGTYKKAHRHGADFHVFSVTGTGYSLFWYEDEEDYVRVDWQHGVVFAPPDAIYHQHFNSGTTRARYMALRDGKGGFIAPNTPVGGDVSLKKGGIQVEYEDEDPRVHRIFEEELAKRGQECRMKNLIAECTGVAGPENKKGALQAYR